MRKKKLLVYLFSIAIALLAGALGSFFTTPAIDTWYASINKPAFTPPNWIFGPVWTLLYIFMGIAAAMIWHKAYSKERSSALGLYILQLILNSLWSIVFFGLQRPDFALIIIIFLLSIIVLMTLQCYRLEKKTFWLLLPYILWVSFASLLNISIWWLNS